MLILVLSFLMSFALVFSISPSVIRIANEKGLVAKAVNRSSHKIPTPCIGGIPIFMGIMFTTLLLTPHHQWDTLQYILGATVIVFMVGFKDDIEGLSAWKKMVGLIVAISILVLKGGVQLKGMYGLFGIEAEFPGWLSMIITGFTLLVISNAFNLIDGINGLSGVVGTIASVTFGIYFFMVDQFYLGVLSMTTAGSLLAFLHFNISPARTFMGDTGALVIGLLLGIFTIKFIEVGSGADILPQYRFVNPVAVAVSIMIIPLFDTIRVFTTRALRGVSPFTPDRRHIHHLLIDSGLDHMQATAVLGLTNLSFISTIFYLDSFVELHTLIGLQLVVALAITYFLHRNVVRINAEKQALADNRAIEINPKVV
ncbi:glycosyltransferase family 4 protein [Neolewinella aurantiaca]|nr:MraY family glycosyltransferase [Neolewinella aurantiaca]